MGTFNPETPSNRADFFYSTDRNYLWRLLPEAFGERSLRHETTAAKRRFICSKRIDFIDLIESVEVELGHEGDRRDIYIDSCVKSWVDVANVIGQLPKLQRVCFTRKTFTRIPNIRTKVEAISENLSDRSMNVECLVSPARYYSSAKQEEWTRFLRSA